jgi:hypothetical protein
MLSWARLMICTRGLIVAFIACKSMFARKLRGSVTSRASGIDISKLGVASSPSKY